MTSRAWLAGLLLVAATAVVYSPVTDAGFVWDDSVDVTGNRAMGSADGLLRIWVEPTTVVPQYYPLNFTSLWLEHALWEFEPRGYHVTNVLLHTLTTLLFWRLLVRLGLPGAWLAAALFALHPVNVESVAWVTERKNTLSTFFYVAALYAYTHFEPLGPGARRGKRSGRGAYLLSLLLFLAALLSKTATLSLPLAIALLVWWRRGSLARRDVMPLLPMLVLGVAIAPVTIWMEKYHVRAQGAVWETGLAERLLVAGRAFWFYARQVVWPFPLMAIYPRWTVDPASLGGWLYPFTALATGVGLFLARTRIGRAPIATFVFFGVTLLPVLGFFDFFYTRYSWVADRFFYLPGLGAIALVSCWAAGRVERWSATPRRFALVFAAVLVAAAGASSWSRCRVWHDEDTLWKDTVKRNPAAWAAWNNLGNVHAGRGDSAAAIEHYRRSVELNPDWNVARRNLGLHLFRNGELAEAAAQFRDALAADPDDLESRLHLGMSLRRLGHIDDALPILEETARAAPDDPAANAELGMALGGLGRLDEAAVRLLRAAELEPTNAATEEFAGQVLMLLERAEESRAHLERAIALDASRAGAHGKLAWLLATDPDPSRRDSRRAVALAEEAHRLDDDDPALLDALAAAYADAGQFEEAVSAARSALDLARTAGEEAVERGVEVRLTLYLRGRPFRRPPGASPGR